MEIKKFKVWDKNNGCYVDNEVMALGSDGELYYLWLGKYEKINKDDYEIEEGYTN